MGINPNVMKNPMDYLREEKTEEMKEEERRRDPGINDTDLFNEGNNEDTWVPTDEETVRNAKFLQSIGIDVYNLSVNQVNMINKVRDPKSLTSQETTAFFKALGVNMHKLVKVMKDRVENCKEGENPDEDRIDICTKVRRNEKCPCDSGRKFKKCCGKED
ncbi:SEC-C metal-binding domain-containing protein [Pirellulaceae bacterium]|jgi:uncharacterized protein YchJ|nr:SEC-C metal-binding domain-containing protein [Pirellulaceae bacterium]